MEWPEAVGVGMVVGGIALIAIGAVLGVWHKNQSIVELFEIDAWIPDEDSGKAVWASGLGWLLILVGFFMAILGPSAVGDPEEGDPCDPGERPPPGFVCD